MEPRSSALDARNICRQSTFMRLQVDVSVTAVVFYIDTLYFAKCFHRLFSPAGGWKHGRLQSLPRHATKLWEPCQHMLVQDCGQLSGLGGYSWWVAPAPHNLDTVFRAQLFTAGRIQSNVPFAACCMRVDRDDGVVAQPPPVQSSTKLSGPVQMPGLLRLIRAALASVPKLPETSNDMLNISCASRWPLGSASAPRI